MKPRPLSEYTTEQDRHHALNKLNEVVKRLLSEALKLKRRQQTYFGKQPLKIIEPK